MKPIVVKKFGGAGLSSIEKVREAAQSIKQSHDQGNQTIAVVSAMGKTTDRLVSKAYEISSRPDRRELDMLISTGERVSMALLTMALKDLGCNAISFTGSQAGVLTDSSHGFASILEVKPIRVEESLAENKVVVVAGFQGVDPKTKEITTLGRGGTDVTAVALAGHFKAQRCEIIKEVNGIYTADPNRVEKAQRIEKINYQTLLHMCRWGAKALHFRSVELAEKLNTPIWVGALDHPELGTLCSHDGSGVGMNTLENLFCLDAENTGATWKLLTGLFQEKGWQLPLAIHEDSHHLWLQGDKNIYSTVKDHLQDVAASSVSAHNFQCVTFSGFETGKTLTNEHSRFSSPLGEHHFLTQTMDETWMNQLYQEHLAPRL